MQVQQGKYIKHLPATKEISRSMRIVTSGWGWGLHTKCIAMNVEGFWCHNFIEAINDVTVL